ncbi:hypothetical protein FKM82_021223 [Ascaphus truei]
MCSLKFNMQQNWSRSFSIGILCQRSLILSHRTVGLKCCLQLMLVTFLYYGHGKKLLVEHIYFPVSSPFHIVATAVYKMSRYP